MNRPRLLKSSEVTIREIDFFGKYIIPTLDLEADFASNRFEGINFLPRLLEIFQSRNLFLTVFVEGRILGQLPGVIEKIASGGHDIQLHCYDHTQSNDTLEAIQCGIRAYENIFGYSPKGYRANTYRLTASIFEALIKCGFKYDSSLLPTFINPGLRVDPDWFKYADKILLIDDTLIEIPLSAFQKLPIPIGQSYRVLLDRLFPMDSLSVFRLPRICIYNMHLVDLFRLTGALTDARIPAPMKILYRLMWSGGKRDSLDLLSSALDFFMEHGYEGTTMSSMAEMATQKN